MRFYGSLFIGILLVVALQLWVVFPALKYIEQFELRAFLGLVYCLSSASLVMWVANKGMDKDLK